MSNGKDIDRATALVCAEIDECRTQARINRDDELLGKLDDAMRSIQDVRELFYQRRFNK